MLTVGSLFAGYGGIEFALSSVLDVRPAWFVDRYNRGTCLVCAEPVKLRACGGRWYGGANSWGPQLHGPGPGLIEPCEFHGWRELTKATDSNGQPVVACRCKCVRATQ